MDSWRKTSTVILNCRSCLVNFYLAKCFVIIKQNFKQLSSVPNDVKLKTHVIGKQKNRFLWRAPQPFPQQQTL